MLNVEEDGQGSHFGIGNDFFRGDCVAGYGVLTTLADSAAFDVPVGFPGQGG